MERDWAEPVEAVAVVGKKYPPFPKFNFGEARTILISSKMSIIN